MSAFYLLFCLSKRLCCAAFNSIFLYRLNSVTEAHNKLKRFLVVIKKKKNRYSNRALWFNFGSAAFLCR